MDTSQRTVAWSTRESRERERPSERDRVVPLDAWSSHPWTDGVQVDELPPFETIEVRTRNTVYTLVIVDGRNGEALVSGGRFFPVATRVRVNGCTLGGSCLKWRGVYPGFLMELQVGNEVIVTTRVRSVDRREVTTKPTSKPH